MGKYREDLNLLSKIRAFWDSEPHTNEDKVIREIIRTCYGFGGMPVKKSKHIYQDYNPFNKLKRSLEKFKDALKDTKITNKDYGEVIHKYNNTDSFFFFDPPYENKNKIFGYAEDTDFDFKRLATLLRLIKGKFLMNNK
jgi:site-specific DNA-adenine methylase